MNKLTTISTIKKAAPLALLAVVMSGSALAGPKGERPKGPKLSIDVENECVLEGTSLFIYTTVTPSDSQVGDGGGAIGQPLAVAAFKVPECKFNKNGKEVGCSAEFQPTGKSYPMAGSAPSFNTEIKLCEENPYLGDESVVNAFISVPVHYDPDGNPDSGDESETTWTSRCDDIAKEGMYPDGDFIWIDSDYDGEVDDGEMVDIVDQSEIELYFDEDPCTS